jgi:hypothetical protein
MAGVEQLAFVMAQKALSEAIAFRLIQRMLLAMAAAPIGLLIT